METKSIKSLLGCKLFLESDDSDKPKIIRVIKVYNNGKLMIRHENNGLTEKLTMEQLKGWVKLKPDGVLSASTVTMKDSQDVIVTMYRYVDLAVTTMPRVICRQSITDFFYTYLSNEENHEMVGVSASQMNCPTNIDFSTLLHCSDVTYSQLVNFYRTDDLDDVLGILNLPKFDSVLSSLYDAHVAYVGNPALNFKDYDKGWCKTLPTLLKANNFWVDVDQELNIVDVDFNLEDYLTPVQDFSNKTVLTVNKEVTDFFSEQYRINMSKAMAIRYDHDVDLSDFNSINYMLIRCSGHKGLWLMTYYRDGEYIETDIEVINMRKHINDNLRMYIFDKYNKK